MDESARERGLGKEGESVKQTEIRENDCEKERQSDRGKRSTLCSIHDVCVCACV